MCDGTFLFFRLPASDHGSFLCCRRHSGVLPSHGSYADDDAGGRQIWFETGIYPGPKVDATALKSRYIQLVTGIAHIW